MNKSISDELDEILDMEKVGDVVNSAFEVHTLSGTEPNIECIHIEQWAKERAKQAIQALIDTKVNEAYKVGYTKGVIDNSINKDELVNEARIDELEAFGEDDNGGYYLTRNGNNINERLATLKSKENKQTR